jgi:hypothetical protein
VTDATTKTLAEATAPADLEGIYWLLHGRCKLDVDNLAHDKETGRVELPLVCEENPPPDAVATCFIVGSVRDLTLLDPEKIGTYWLEGVQYDERDKTWLIEAVPGLLIKVAVDRIDAKVLGRSTKGDLGVSDGA